MDGQYLRTGCCALLAGFLAQAGAPPRAYLPRVGPLPLRFRPLPVFTPPVYNLPPLPFAEPQPGTNVSAAIYVSEPAPPTPKPEVTTAGPTNAPPAQVTAENGIISGSPSAAPQVTPQMLIDYFRGEPGENKGVQVIAPLNSFVPPVWTPPPAPSSSATYKSN